jgi:hypothetical protein
MSGDADHGRALVDRLFDLERLTPEWEQALAELRVWSMADWEPQDHRERIRTMSTAHEYRITKARPVHPDLREVVMTFRDDDPTWMEWIPNSEDFDQGDEKGIDYRGLSGVLGIVEATAREEENKGAKAVRVEVREVGPWTEVQR